jgi:hypothetical protein
MGFEDDFRRLEEHVANARRLQQHPKVKRT